MEENEFCTSACAFEGFFCIQIFCHNFHMKMICFQNALLICVQEDDFCDGKVSRRTRIDTSDLLDLKVNIGLFQLSLKLDMYIFAL